MFTPSRATEPRNIERETFPIYITKNAVAFLTISKEMRNGVIMINKLIAVGTITSVRSNKEKTAGGLSIAVNTAERVFKRGQGMQTEAEDDYFFLRFSDKQSKTQGIATNFKVGDHVKIEGYAGSSRRYGTSEERSFFMINEIRHDETKFEQVFGVAGGQRSADEVVLLIEGTLQGMSMTNRQGIRVRIGVDTPNGTSYVNAVAYDEQANAVKKFLIGSTAWFSIQPKTLDTKYAKERHLDTIQFRITGVAKPQNDAARSVDSNKKPRRKKRAKRPSDNQDIIKALKDTSNETPITKRPNIVTSFTPSPVISNEIPEFDED